MRFNLSLAVAIAVAVGWALFVFGTYFLLISAHFWPFTRWPFADWSASDQAQLFQGMVGIAGFGGGIVALFFAGQQLSHLFGSPKIVVRFRRWHNPYASTDEQRDASREYLDSRVSVDDRQIMFEVELQNMGNAISSTWLVDMRVPIGAGVGAISPNWQSVSDEETSRQAGERDALYPGTPLPIGLIGVGVAEDKTPGWVPTPSGRSSCTIPLWTRVMTERGSREQTLEITFKPREAEASSDEAFAPDTRFMSPDRSEYGGND